jgi:hypothetical protein
MTKIEYLTPEGREALESERILELKRRHAEEVAQLERKAAEEKAEYQRRMALVDQSVLLRSAKDGSEELMRLQSSFEHSTLSEEQRALVKEAARFYGKDSGKNSGDLNRIAISDISRYQKIRQTAVALNLVRG